MGERLARETFVDADAMRRSVMPALEKVFVLLRARAECDKERAGIENPARSVANQVVAFLRDEPRNDRDNWTLGFFRQTEASQQIDFALAFAG